MKEERSLLAEAEKLRVKGKEENERHESAIATINAQAFQCRERQECLRTAILMAEVKLESPGHLPVFISDNHQGRLGADDDDGAEDNDDD